MLHFLDSETFNILTKMRVQWQSFQPEFLRSLCMWCMEMMKENPQGHYKNVHTWLLLAASLQVAVFGDGEIQSLINRGKTNYGSVTLHLYITSQYHFQPAPPLHHNFQYKIIRECSIQSFDFQLKNLTSLIFLPPHKHWCPIAS